MATLTELFDPNANLQPLPAPLKDFIDVVDELIAGHMGKTLKNTGTGLLDFLKDKTQEWFKQDYSYTDTHIAKQLFITQVQVKDWRSQVRIQILALRKSLSRLIAITDSYLSQNMTLAIGPLRLLQDMAYASVALLEDGEMACSSKTIKYAAGRPNVRGSLEIWKASQDLFYGQMHDWSIGSVAYRPTSVFLVRQALELRFKNIFGVLVVQDKEGRPVRLKSDFFIQMYESCKEAIKLPIDVGIITKIRTWSNVYIHSGIEPTPWEIEWALHILQPLFAGGTCGGTSSVHGSVRLLTEVYNSIPDRIQKAVDEDMNARSSIWRKLSFWLSKLFRKNVNSCIAVVRLPSPEAILVKDKASLLN